MQRSVDEEFYCDPVVGLSEYRMLTEIDLGLTQLSNYDTGLSTGDVNGIVNKALNVALAGRVPQDV